MLEQFSAMYRLVIGVLLILEAFVEAKGDGSEVHLQQGSIKGRTMETKEGASFDAYTGIPYAQPPIGELRFKEPMPSVPWNGILDATKRIPVCLQYSVKNKKLIVGKEDCLYLNVYSPYRFLDSKKHLAVMVFIHGGGFIAGSGRLDNYGPQYFMNNDVVLVTFNYRLGPFGFLTTGDAVLPGNNGLKDQELAIQWVRDNIERFGGDPHLITIFGQSAGAVSAHLQMLFSSTNGFVKGVIAQSGTAFIPRIIIPAEEAKNYTVILAGLLACPTLDTSELVGCLRETEVNMILEVSSKVDEKLVIDVTCFRPVVEPDIPGALITMHPADVKNVGSFENISFMTGINSDEGDFLMFALDKMEVIKKLVADFLKYAPVYLLYGNTIKSKYLKRAIIDVQEFYFPDGEITDFGISRIHTDLRFLTGADAAVEMHHNVSKKPIYYYLFGYKGSSSYCSLFETQDYYGVCHNDELLYLFNNSFLFPNYKPTQVDHEISKLMITLWTNFAKYGDPTPYNEYQYGLDRWVPYSTEDEYYYYIKKNGSIKVGQHMVQKRTEFWRHLLKESQLIGKEEL